jgi:hypothetical protein
MRTEDIARVAHEVNRAFCEANGDYSQRKWEEAEQWQRESAVKGVEFALLNPNATPADQHQSWVDAKRADGWVLGPIKDAKAKMHPCMLPYEQLPLIQKTKDHLFRSVVAALKVLP